MVIFFCNFNGFAYMIFGVTAPFSPFVLLLSIIILYFSIFVKKMVVDSTPLQILLLFYILSLFIGTSSYLFDPTNVHPKTSLIRIFRIYISSMILITAIYLGVKNIVIEKGLNYILGFIFLSSLVPIIIIAIAPLIGINSLYNFASQNTLTQSRATGLFNNPNEAGAFASYFLVICLSCYSQFKKSYMLFFIGVPFALYVSFLTLSRTSIILSVALIFFYLLFNLKFIKKLNSSNALKAIIFSGVICYATIVSINKFFDVVGEMNYGQRMRLMETFQLLSGDINEKTTSERSHIYSFAFEEVKKQPIFGYGLGAFRRMVNLPGPKKLGAHNTHLLIWGETGIIPITLFVVFFILLGLRAINHNSPMIGFFILGICSVYFLGICGTGHNGLENRMSNILIAITIAFTQIKIRKRPLINTNEK